MLLSQVAGIRVARVYLTNWIYALLLTFLVIFLILNVSFPNDLSISLKKGKQKYLAWGRNEGCGSKRFVKNFCWHTPLLYEGSRKWLFDLLDKMKMFLLPNHLCSFQWLTTKVQLLAPAYRRCFFTLKHCTFLLLNRMLIQSNLAEEFCHFFDVSWSPFLHAEC